MLIEHIYIVSTSYLKVDQIGLTVFSLQNGHKISFIYVTRGIIEKLTCKSYASCAWHVVWMCFTNIWSFVELSLSVIKL